MGSNRAPPTVSVPVLSNSTVCTRASASSGLPPLTRMPRRACLRHTGDEGDRCGQDQWTRRCRHQHGERADQIAEIAKRRRRALTSRKGKSKRSGQPGARTALSGFAPRSPGARCPHRCFHQPPGHRKLKSFAGVQRTREDGGGPRFHHRNRLTRQCRPSMVASVD